MCDENSFISTGDVTNMLHVEVVKSAIRKRGNKLRDVAEYAGVSSSTVCNVLAGRGTSARVVSVVSEMSGIPQGAIEQAIEEQKTLRKIVRIDGNRRE